MQSISLLELNRQIAEVVNTTFDGLIWVVAEISEIRTASNGHCYLELIEKSGRNNSIVARARATIWSNRWWLIKENFEQQTGQALVAGMKILSCVQVQMHEAYGFSLNIADIDPSFTLGEMALRRQEIISRLTAEGMIDMNKELELPVLPQRIAIISAPNAAGYGDFCHQIQHNDYGIQFYIHLFAASMQGERTAASIIEALEHIYQHCDKFDAVVIIRGGGGVADLSSFDNYDLAVNIANFPLPVIVGIGHERDFTVLDLVAHTSVKTPTAAAALLIDILADQLSQIQDLRLNMYNAIDRLIEHNKTLVGRYLSDIQSTHVKLRDQINHLSLLSERTRLYASMAIDSQRQKHVLFERTIEMISPENILKRGFSITRINGHSVKDPAAISDGDIIETQTIGGVLKSKKI